MCVKMWETGRSLEPGSLMTSSTPCISETYSVFSAARVTCQASGIGMFVNALYGREKIRRQVRTQNSKGLLFGLARFQVTNSRESAR